MFGLKNFIFAAICVGIFGQEPHEDGSGVLAEIEGEEGSGLGSEFGVMPKEEMKEKPSVKKGVSVKGKLVCAGRPLVNTKVKLYDISMGKFSTKTLRRGSASGVARVPAREGSCGVDKIMIFK